MEISYNSNNGRAKSLLNGVIQESPDFRLIVNWNLLCSYLSKFGELTPEIAFEELERRGIFSKNPRGNYKVWDVAEKRFSPEDYSLTSEEYIQQYTRDLFNNRNIEIWRCFSSQLRT